MAPAMLLEETREPLLSCPSVSEDADNSCGSSQPVVELSSGKKPVLNVDRAYKQGIWTLQELLILQAVRREDIVRRKEGFERQLKEGLAQKELKSRVERWQEIEEACWARGVYRSAEQCQSRWEYMSREWRRIHHHETSCTRFGEPSYWTMTPAERTQKGLVSNFYYELYLALLEWVGKLTRNVPFHQCPGTSEAVHSAAYIECPSSDLCGGYAECQMNDANVDTGDIPCSGQTRPLGHDGAGQSCSNFVPQFSGSRPYQYPAYPSFGTCGPGAIFPPFPYSPPWIHPPPYSVHPGFFQQPSVNLCGQMPVRTPSASSVPCASAVLPSNCASYCSCRSVSAGLSSPFPSCRCASCAAVPVASGHTCTCTGICQHSAKHFNSGTESTIDTSQMLSGQPCHPGPEFPKEATESGLASDFSQRLENVMHPSHTSCNATFYPRPSGPSHHQCSVCTSGTSFPPSFARPPPSFFYGAPVYLPYPCPRCNLSPFGYSYQPSPYRDHSGCPLSSGPPFWGTPEGKAPEDSLQGSHFDEVEDNTVAGVGSDRQQADGGTTHVEEYPVRDIYAESQEVEDPQYDDEPHFVLTEEWAEFFAKSEAQRREKKRQQQRKAKAARKAAKAAWSSQEVDGHRVPDGNHASSQDIVAGEQGSSSFAETNQRDSEVYI